MGTMLLLLFDCHRSCCRREDHIDSISLGVDWARVQGGDEEGGRTAFEGFFFCVWFLFSRLDSFLIIQGAKSLVDGWSGEQSSSAGDFSCWWRDNIWSRAGWWAARMVGWVAGREQPCLEVGAAADSVWLPVAGARQWELPLSATAIDQPHHTHITVTVTGHY